MKRLTKAQWAQITEAMDDCEKTGAALTTTIDLSNQALDKINSEVQDRMNEYNESVEKLHGVYANLAGAAQEYFDERSETWQEGEAGATYAEWIDQLSAVDGAEAVDIELPDEIEQPDLPDYTDTTWLPPEAPGE
jgi:hypothetical protein